ncbi:MAG: helix-turn-helix domain-containing protein [Roseburia sp.]|nr:helix-turn-helix domain-containing protein [Roseburia sp.]
MKILSERLKELRKGSNLSQKQLAEILHTTNSSICDWECGRAEPNLSFVVQIADYFGVSCDYLLGKTEY